jgi:hypothetical protein
MRFPTTCLAITALAFMITGCAQHASTASSNDLAEIRYEVGPCYGTCPVYSVAVEADGTTHYTGERHTAVAGERTQAGDAATFRSLQQRLATMQPEMGTTQQSLDCEPRATETCHITRSRGLTRGANRPCLSTIQAATLRTVVNAPRL